MADALDSGSSGSNPVRVQVPFSAFSIFYNPLKTQRFQGVFDSQITIWSKHGANCFFTKDGTIFQISPELLAAPGISLYADRFVVKQSAVLGIGLELDDVVRPRIRDKARPLAIELREPFLDRAVVDLHLQRRIRIIR